MKHNLRRIAALTAAAGLAFVFTVGSVNAQSKKPKRSKSSKPAVTVPPASSEPAVVSRASDFPDSSVELVPVEPIKQSIANATKTSDETSRSLDDLAARIKELEAKSGKTDADEKHKRLLLNLDILTRAEQRSETLRKQLFDMIEKENSVKTRLEVIENDIRPEAIDRTVAFAGTLRPEELRAMRRKNLEVERANLQNLLSEIQKTKLSLELNVQKADGLVDRLRERLEKEIDSALIEESEKKP